MNKLYVWKLPPASVFRCVFDSAKFKLLIFFFACLFFYQFSSWTCLSKNIWKDMTDTIKHFEQLLQASVFCVLSCILFIQKSSSIFHTEQSCDRLKFEMSAALGKKKIKKLAFRSGFPIYHKLWDIELFFFSLTLTWMTDVQQCAPLREILCFRPVINGGTFDAVYWR